MEPTWKIKLNRVQDKEALERWFRLNDMVYIMVYRPVADSYTFTFKDERAKNEIMNNIIAHFNNYKHIKTHGLPTLELEPALEV